MNARKQHKIIQRNFHSGLIFLATLFAVLTPSKSSHGVEVFVPSQYLRYATDVRAAGVDPTQHWNQSGKKECRRGSDKFYILDYFELNPTVKAEVNGDCALGIAHYESMGRMRYLRTAKDYLPETVFDPEVYLALNPDVKAAGVEPLSHFLSSGMSECRRGSHLFDVKQYLAMYSDLRQAFGGDCRRAIYHYLDDGRYAGRRGIRRTLPMPKQIGSCVISVRTCPNLRTNIPSLIQDPELKNDNIACMARAEEIKELCQSMAPVSALYFSGEKLIHKTVFYKPGRTFQHLLSEKRKHQADPLPVIRVVNSILLGE